MTVELNDRKLNNKITGLSGSTLKLIAVFTMLVDHIAAVLLVKWMVAKGVLELMDYNGSRVMMIMTSAHGEVLDLYGVMRDIGRIAFPIYCFLLVEGFMHTRNIRKYMGRMLLLAFLSEIPFDLAFGAQLFFAEYQNVMFTLFLGLLAMYISSRIELCTENLYVRWGLAALTWAAAAGGAELLQADYGYKGILCIAVLYILRFERKMQLIGGAASFFWELPAPAAFLFPALYNGRKGMDVKVFFYAFYPVHLLILYGISAALGMGGIRVV